LEFVRARASPMMPRLDVENTRGRGWRNEALEEEDEEDEDEEEEQQE
jgi:hypothetical protein